MRRILNKKL